MMAEPLTELESAATADMLTEDRWLGGARLGNGSTDEIAGSLCNMLDFTRARHADPIFLDPIEGTPITRSKLRPSE